MHRRYLTYEELQMVLELHMFLKQIWEGGIKWRTVSGGKKNWTYIPEEEASSPTVSTQYALLTSIVDAGGNMAVAAIDITNAFIQMRVEEKMDMEIIKLRELLVDILCIISSD